MSRTTLRDLAERYADGEPLTMLTAYDAPTARLADAAGVDVLLMGDSVGNTRLGFEDTIAVTLDQTVSHTAAVVRGSEAAFVVADLPFGAYGGSIEQSVESATRLVKEAGAQAVKLETAPGGDTTVELVDRLTELGVPVMGHVGQTPQRAHEIGWGVVQGRGGPDSAAADELVQTARELADAGAFAIVLELVTEPVARRITETVDVPTIGIGAGRHVDGQVLVIDDVIGLSEETFKIAKRYANVGEAIQEAAAAFVEEVRTGEFPTADNAFEPVDE